MKPGQLIRIAIPLVVGLFLTFTVNMTAQVKTETTQKPERRRRQLQWSAAR